MQHSGSCHCGNVAFAVEGEVKQAIPCIRRLEDFDSAFVPAKQLDGLAL